MEQNRFDYLQAKAATFTDLLTDTDDEGNHDDAFIADVTVFLQATDDGSSRSDVPYIVEYLVEYNGPTTRIVIDSRWGKATIESSDGPVDSESYSYESVEMYGRSADAWLDEAESTADLYR